MLINMFSAEVKANPFPVYQVIRDLGRVVYDDNNHMWFVSHYTDVSQVLRDTNHFSTHFSSIESTLLGRDGNLHSETRKKITPAFQASILEGISASIEHKATTTVSNLLENRLHDIEVVTHLSGIVPLAVFSWMFGTPFESVEAFRRWSDSIISSGNQRLPSTRLSPWIHRLKRHLRGKKPNDSKLALHECETWLRSLFLKTSSKNKSGWLFELLESHHKSGSLSLEEIIEISFVMVVAATETTTSAITNAMHLLACRPELQEELRSYPEHINTFIEELLRYESPVQRRSRIVSESVTIADTLLKKGDKVMLLIGSANRDPSQFKDAETFIIDRNPNKHLAFGAGSHFCMGAQLARLELNATLSAVIAQTSFFKMTDQSQQIVHPELIQLRGPRKLNLDFSL